MEFVSVTDFGEDELRKIYSLSPFDMIVAVAEKASKKDLLCSDHMKASTSKKPLPFDLNSKPRTHATQCSTSSTDDTSEKMRRTVRIIRPPVPRPQLEPEPELPLAYKTKIAELGGRDIKFVIEKGLSNSDVHKEKYRLTMPYRQCRVDLGRIGETKVKAIHPVAKTNELSEMILTLKRWDTVSSYVFTTGTWNNLVAVTGFKAEDKLQVWCFKRQAEELCFALVILRKQTKLP